MSGSLIPLLSYVFISTFTPGPSNISTASLAVLHGYKNTLKYQAGLAVGVFLLMFLSGWFSASLLDLFPVLEPILRYAGAAYILYLAFGILKASYTFKEKDTKSMQFTHGLMLNVLNPKLVVYSFTLFSAFLAPITTDALLLIVACLLLAFISLCATSVWAAFGTIIQVFLGNPRLRFIINLLLSLMLVYTAATLIGIF
jgi:cysteine/O-acetylserine efflux protein